MKEGKEREGKKMKKKRGNLNNQQLPIKKLVFELCRAWHLFCFLSILMTIDWLAEPSFSSLIAKCIKSIV